MTLNVVDLHLPLQIFIITLTSVVDPISFIITPTVRSFRRGGRACRAVRACRSVRTIVMRFLLPVFVRVELPWSETAFSQHVSVLLERLSVFCQCFRATLQSQPSGGAVQHRVEDFPRSQTVKLFEPFARFLQVRSTAGTLGKLRVHHTHVWQVVELDGFDGVQRIVRSEV